MFKPELDVFGHSDELTFRCFTLKNPRRERSR